MAMISTCAQCGQKVLCPNCHPKPRRPRSGAWPPAYPGHEASETELRAFYKATSCLEDARFLLKHASQYATAEQEAELLHLIDELETRPSTQADRRTYHRIHDQILAQRHPPTIDEEGFFRTWRRYPAASRRGQGWVPPVLFEIYEQASPALAVADAASQLHPEIQRQGAATVHDAIAGLQGIATKADRILSLDGFDARRICYAKNGRAYTDGQS